MIFDFQNYRSYLKAVFAERAGRRPAYSVRAFAKQLGLAQSFLAEILRNKKNLSSDGALRVALALGLTREETDYFLSLVQLETTADEDSRASILERLGTQRPGAKGRIADLSVDAFKLIADWYHLPILELTYLKGFTFTADNVARRLGISPTEAEVAIERLLRLELLEHAGGRYRKTDSYFLFNSAIPNKAVARCHGQFIEKAKAAIEVLSPSERFGASEVYPLPPSKLKEARAILETALDRIRRLSEQTPVKTEVFALSIHLFPITRPDTRRTTEPHKGNPMRKEVAGKEVQGATP